MINHVFFDFFFFVLYHLKSDSVSLCIREQSDTGTVRARTKRMMTKGATWQRRRASMFGT